MNSSKMPSVTARRPLSSQPSPSPSSILSTAQSSRPIKIPPPPTLADIVSEPGGLMKMKATIEAIYAMDDVEYDERVVKRQQRGYPNRYGKYGERCSTVKLVSLARFQVLHRRERTLKIFAVSVGLQAYKLSCPQNQTGCRRSVSQLQSGDRLRQLLSRVRQNGMKNTNRLPI